jgi:hypothetical protein
MTLWPNGFRVGDYKNAVKQEFSDAFSDRGFQLFSAAQEGLALNPTFTITRARAAPPSDNPIYLAQRERIYEGMRKARVPEG